MFKFLLIIQALVATGLVTLILMQRSEGGGLGVGGSSSGLLTARAAADFLTRATAVMATLFVVLSIVLAGLAAVSAAPSEFDDSLVTQQPAGSTVPLANGSAQPAAPAAPVAIPDAPAPAAAGDVPLAQPAEQNNAQ